MTSTEPLPAINISVEDERPRADRPVLRSGTRTELADLLRRVLADEGVGEYAQAGLNLLDEAEMSELNEKHMGWAQPTDVLSFPIDGIGGGVGWIVGDVVICPSRAESQAASHTGSLDDELRLLVVHGALHLCGWDHVESDERDRMWARERELLEKYAALPPLDPWATSTVTEDNP
jgi:probable rRNA maturation factor